MKALEEVVQTTCICSGGKQGAWKGYSVLSIEVGGSLLPEDSTAHLGSENKQKDAAIWESAVAMCFPSVSTGIKILVHLSLYDFNQFTFTNRLFFSFIK